MHKKVLILASIGYFTSLYAMEHEGPHVSENRAESIQVIIEDEQGHKIIKAMPPHATELSLFIHNAYEFNKHKSDTPIPIVIKSFNGAATEKVIDDLNNMAQKAPAVFRRMFLEDEIPVDHLAAEINCADYLGADPLLPFFALKLLDSAQKKIYTPDDVIQLICFIDNETIRQMMNDTYHEYLKLNAPWEVERLFSPSPMSLAEFNHLGRINSIAFSPNGTLLAFASSAGVTHIWDINKLKKIIELPEPSLSQATAVAFSPTGTQLVIGSSNGNARVWDITIKEFTGELHGHHTGKITSVAWSPDGSKIATGSLDDTICLWDAHNYHLIHTPLQGHLSEVTAVAFSPNKEIIATGSQDGTARLWNVNSHKLLHTLEGHIASINSVAFSPDGTLIATGSADQSVRLWKVDTGELIKIFEGHTAPVTSLAFSPDNTLLLSGSWDRTARFWDVSTLQPFGTTLESPGNPINIATFSPDRKKIVLGLFDVIQIWHQPLIQDFDNKLQEALQKETKDYHE